MLYQRINLLVLLCFSIITSGISAQSIEQLVGRADSLYASGSYEKAILEYQRAIFFSGELSPVYFQTKTALCYASLGDKKEAKKYFDLAATACINDSLEAEIIFQVAILYIEECNYYGAVGLLKSVRTDAGEECIRKKNYLLGMAYWGLNEFDRSFDSFYHSIYPDEIGKRAELVNIRSQYQESLKIKPSVLPFLSSIIPGSGQIISGKIGEGLASFFLCVGIGLLGVGSVFVLQNNVIFLNLSPWFLRYYFGGIRETVEIVNQNRIKIKKGVFQNILELVEWDGFGYQFLYYDSFSLDKRVAPELPEGAGFVDKLFGFYKKQISHQDIMDCIYYPSCSVYVLGTIRTNGVLGIFDAIDRLTRCHLFGHDSYELHEGSNLYYDPVEEILK